MGYGRCLLGQPSGCEPFPQPWNRKDLAAMWRKVLETGQIELEVSEEHPSRCPRASWIYRAEMWGLWATCTNFRVVSLFAFWIWIKLPCKHVEGRGLEAGDLRWSYSGCYTLEEAVIKWSSLVIREMVGRLGELRGGYHPNMSVTHKGWAPLLLEQTWGQPGRVNGGHFELSREEAKRITGLRQQIGRLPK